MRHALTRWGGLTRLVLLGLCAACAPSTPTPTIFPPTATLTPPALIAPETAAPLPTEPPASVAPLEPTLELTPTALIPCANDSKFGEDLTVPDGAQYLPGQTFIKKWSVTNTGTCDWGPDYRLVLVNGDALGAPPEVALYPARVGKIAILEIPMKAPDAPGVYTSRWEARAPDGVLFGSFVTVKIEVLPLPATNTPTP